MGLTVTHTKSEENADLLRAIAGACGLRREATGYVLLVTDSAGVMAPRMLSNIIDTDAIASLLATLLIALLGPQGAVAITDAFLGSRN